MHQLLLKNLRELWSIEEQLVAALPGMIKKATALRLRAALENHLNVTRLQLGRLENVGRLLDADLSGHTCKAMEALLAEGEKTLAAMKLGAVMDAAIIAACQRAEHVEMAAYGCARTYACLLGLREVQDLMQATLDEEAAADQELTRIAEAGINREAMR